MPGSGRARAPRVVASQAGSNSSNPAINQLNETSGANGSATNTTHPSHAATNTSCQSRAFSSEGSSSKKRGRGPTRGLGLAKKKQRGEPLEVFVSENRLVGRNSKQFVNEIGILIRDYAPLNVRRWKQIPEEDKTKMWEMLRDKFNVPNDEELRECTMQQMNKQFVDFRSLMHTSVFKKYESMEVALQHCPPVLTQDRWRDLCLTFLDSKFQERSKINQQNRAQQTIVHTTGSKGFHCLEFEMTQEAGEKPPMKQFWKTTRTRKNKDGDNVEDGLDVDGEDGLRWVNEAAKKVYEDVEALQLKYLSENGVPLDDDEAFKQVLGYKSGYIRGRGAGPKPISSSTRAKEKEKDAVRDKQVADARREADEANKKVENLQSEVDQLKEKMEMMMNLVMPNHQG